MKFKLGDRVKILGAGIDFDKVGSIRAVIKVDERYVRLEGCLAPWGIESPQLELVNNLSVSEQIDSLLDNLKK